MSAKSDTAQSKAPESRAQKTFWDARHEAFVTEQARREGLRSGVLRKLVRGARLRIGADPSDDYSTFLFHKRLRRHLPVNPNWKAVEVGCAPGRNLIALHRLFGYQPYGVEYSSVGADATRDTLISHGLDPAHVIEADFFAPAFRTTHRAHYDVVLSYGFIEHFDDPRAVVAAHTHILKPGGYLVCLIPNLYSLSYPFLRVFANDFLHVHNCVIMRLRPFTALFDNLGLEAQYCGYCGVCRFFGLALRHERSFRGILVRLLDRSADLLNHLMFVVLRGRAPETSISPNLVYIGRKGPFPA